MIKYGSEYLESLGLVSNNVPNINLLNNKNVIITGSTGLIGSALADVLINQGNVNVFLAGRNKDKVDSRFGHWKGKYQYIPYDCNKSLDWDFSPDYVIHCAGNAHPSAYARQPVETLFSSVTGTRNILEFARKTNTKRVLYVSSSEVYGRRDGNQLYKETDSFKIDFLDPRSCYPIGKRASENLCVSYLKEYGVDSVIVRPGHIYGPTMTKSDSRAHAEFTRCAAHHNNIVMKSEGNQLRSYCYVLDCVSAMLTVLLNGRSGEAYNISNRNANVTIRELAETFAKLSGSGVIFRVPSEIELRGFNRMTCSALDAEKLEQLGWKGIFDVNLGIEQTLLEYFE